MKIFLFFIYCLFLIQSCKTPSRADEGNTSGLLQCWTNSFEEQGNDNLQIYRPCDFKTFPAARYRNMFTLSQNNEAQYQMLSPTDAHYLENGNWSYDEKSRVLLIRNHDNELIHAYHVEEISADKLILKEN